MGGLMVMAYLLVFLFLFTVCLCQSDDRLTPTKPLLPGDVLISDGGAFAFGFFSLKSSTLSSYVGVWYNNIPERTYVWIANRDNPLTINLPGKLVFTNSSDLVLLDSTGHIVWTTTNNITTRDDGAAAILLNSGNFVIQGPAGTGLWESFNYPTDTIVPDISFSLSSTDIAKRLVAWKGPNDPSSSDFSMGGDSDLQIVVWNGTKPYWRRAAWGGNLIRGTFQRNTNFTMYQSIVDTGNGYFIKFTVSDGSPSVRLTLGYTGIVRFLRWDNDTSSWTVFNQFPSPFCDQYAFCGPFAYCDSSTEVIPTCKCLDGFEPDGLNISRGCHRQEELKCDGGDSFLTLPDMKTPDKFLYIRNKSFDQCAEYCSRNCTCTAYAYSTLENVYANTTVDRSRCLVWMGMLIDMEKFNNGFGENLYLRHPSTSVSKKKSALLKIVLPTVASLILLLTCTLIICKSKGNYQGKKTLYKHALQQASKKLGNDNLEYPSIAFEAIITATNNFSHSNLRGKGGFGKVYKGMLEGGKEVAVKRLSKGSTQGVEEFRNEVDLIAKLQHKNLVRLLGCCICEDEKLLIYEFLPNKSLDAFIFDATRKSMLDWPTRIKIIKGVARGILYLHQDSRLKIIHRDLKASNILLDAEMTPKISDFGMARIFGGNEQRANTTRVVGTYGYMSPEYAMDGYFSVKSDTYSFGVLMLEIVSGLKISSPDLIMDFPNLIAFAWNLWKDGKAGELVESSVLDSCSSHEVLRCIHLGLLCVQDQPDARPLMSSIVFMLENEMVPLPTPKQPIFFTRKFGSDQSNEYTRRSLNNMTITTMEGR